MGFVLCMHKEFGFCFVPASTTRVLFCCAINTMAVNTDNSCWLCDFWRGCVNLHTPGSHQSSLNKSTADFSDWAKAIIGLRFDKKIGWILKIMETLPSVLSKMTPCRRRWRWWRGCGWRSRWSQRWTRSWSSGRANGRTTPFSPG